MVLSGLYSILAVCWGVVCAMYFDQIIPLQMWISTVLAFGMIETTSLCAHYEHWSTYSHSLSLSLSLSLTLMGVNYNPQYPHPGVMRTSSSSSYTILSSLPLS